MLHKTRGIVLHSVKYSETSLIAKVYTETFGLQSYILKGIRSQHARIRPALFQPFSLLDLVVYHKEKRTLHPVKEVRVAKPLYKIFSDIRKSSIALFLTELIYRSIREEEADPALFGFLWNSVIHLETTEEPVGNFPLVFAVRFTRFLGFLPHGNRSDSAPFFHLHDGSFNSLFTSPQECLDADQSACFFELMQTGLDQLDRLSFTDKIRSVLLDKVLQYYYIHLPGIKKIRSREILHSVLS